MPNGVSAPGHVSPPLVPISGLTNRARSTVASGPALKSESFASALGDVDGEDDESEEEQAPTAATRAAVSAGMTAWSGFGMAANGTIRSASANHFRTNRPPFTYERGRSATRPY